MRKQKTFNKDVGTWYEELAEDYLKERKCQILEKNFRTRQGEIDLIIKDQEYLVFVEVKYRKNASLGMPYEAVDYKKQRQICRISDYYRVFHQVSEFTPMRFDVISICGSQIDWIKNAFAYIGR